MYTCIYTYTYIYIYLNILTSYVYVHIYICIRSHTIYCQQPQNSHIYIHKVGFQNLYIVAFVYTRCRVSKFASVRERNIAHERERMRARETLRALLLFLSLSFSLSLFFSLPLSSFACSLSDNLPPAHTPSLSLSFSL